MSTASSTPSGHQLDHAFGAEWNAVDVAVSTSHDTTLELERWDEKG